MDKSVLAAFAARHKWFAAVPSLKPGDLVLIVDESTKRGHWPKAIVKEVIPDSNHRKGSDAR